MPTSMSLSHTTFYDSLPKYKIELINGVLFINGDLIYNRLVLEHILRGYGIDYIMPLIDKNLLQDACIEAFGRKRSNEGKIQKYPQVAPTFPVNHLAGQLRMALFAQRRWEVFGKDMVVKLGEDGFTPDIYMYKKNDPRQNSYYFDGAPDLIIEVIHPDMRNFEHEIRLKKYERGNVPEVWFIDHQDRTIELFRLKDGRYENTYSSGESISPLTLPDLFLYPDRLWPEDDNWWQLDVYDAVETLGESFSTKTEKRKPVSEGPAWGSLPFQPEIRLESTPISFEQYVSWAPEAKFEWMGNKPLIGGSEQGNYHLTGLLLMSLGLVETVGLLEEEAWRGYLA